MPLCDSSGTYTRAVWPEPFTPDLLPGYRLYCGISGWCFPQTSNKGRIRAVSQFRFRQRSTVVLERYGMHDQLQQILKSDPGNANDLTTGNSPLGWAAFGHQPKSATILFQHGALADRPPYDSYAWGPAAMVASTDVARVLLEHGASPNWQNEGGNTPIHCVITSRIVLDPAKFIQVLLDFGADASLRNREGRTPLDEALIQTGKNAETYFPVHPIAPKRLEQTIEILRSRLAQTS